MKYIIDRIEEDFAICENIETKEIENFDIILIPEEAKEGDILAYSEITEEYYIDRKETEKRKEGIEKKIENLWE